MLSCLNSKSAPKLERKYVERNRRNHLKNLHKQLHSMLPTYNPKETVPVPVPDQIDEALKYIESLKVNLEKNKKHLEELMRGQPLNLTNELSSTTESRPEIEFHEMGPNMVMVLITGLDNMAIFNNTIRLCHKEGVEVEASHFELNGNSTLQIISHEAEVQISRSSRMEFRATTLCDKIKELIYGPSCENNHEESQLNYLWDYQIEYDALELLPTPSENPSMPSNCMQNVDEITQNLIFYDWT